MIHSIPQLACLLAITGLVMPGCHLPTLMPAEPIANHANPAGGRIAIYDTNRDGQGDYAEQLGPDGRVAVLLFDTDRDGELERRVVRDQLDHTKSRELLIILDSVPYHLVHEFWKEGRFRLFHPPSVIIAPFPAMTDLCLAEFFGVSPCPGVESKYFDGERLSQGVLTYFLEGNAPWLDHIDAYIWPINHGYIYSAPEPSFLHELHLIEQVFFHSDERSVCGYSVGASALGSLKGEPGHRQLLEYVDRFCQSIMRRTGGKVRITLMSDHGHNLTDSNPFSLHKELRAMGYRDGASLRQPGDIVVPRYGPVTCAAIHTREPAKVAAEVIRIEGVDLSFYREGDEIVVRSADGWALIARSGDRYGYVPRQGDPLQLLPILERLREEGKRDAAGFVADADWFAATAEHIYPDPLYRLWRAFDGLMVNTPDVLVSIEDGYCYGTSFFNLWVKLKSAHGSLRRASSHGFVMSTAGKLPDHVRMIGLASELRALGLHPLDDDTDKEPRASARADFPGASRPTSGFSPFVDPCGLKPAAPRGGLLRVSKILDPFQ